MKQMLLRPSQKPVGLWPGVSGSSAARSPAQQAWWCEQAPVGLGLQLCPRTSSEIKKKVEMAHPPQGWMQASVLSQIWKAWSSCCCELVQSEDLQQSTTDLQLWLTVFTAQPLLDFFSLKAHAKPNREEQRAMQKPGYLPTPVTKPVVAYSPILLPI